MKARRILIILLILLSITSIFIGALQLNIIDIISDPDALETLFISRVPRLITVILTAVALSVSGLLMQKLVMNNFVSPSTGATLASAQLGIVISLVFISNSPLWFKSIFAFIFSIVGTMLFIAFVNIMNFKNKVMVPLVGIMFGYIISGLTQFLAFNFDLTQTLSTWMVGNFSLILRGRYEIVYITLPLIILAYIYAKYFNIVGMGKDMSKNLGVSYDVILILGLAISSILAASTVVVVGSISYVGLIIPNIVSQFQGDDIKKTLVNTSLAGATYLLFCDIIARLIIFPYELPVELVSGVFGSIIFILLLLDKAGVKTINKLFNKFRGNKIEKQN